MGARFAFAIEVGFLLAMSAVGFGAVYHLFTRTLSPAQWSFLVGAPCLACFFLASAAAMVPGFCGRFRVEWPMPVTWPGIYLLCLVASTRLALTPPNVLTTSRPEVEIMAFWLQPWVGAVLLAMHFALLAGMGRRFGRSGDSKSTSP